MSSILDSSGISTTYLDFSPKELFPSLTAEHYRIAELATRILSEKTPMKGDGKACNDYHKLELEDFNDFWLKEERGSENLISKICNMLLSAMSPPDLLIYGAMLGYQLEHAKDQVRIKGVFRKKQVEAMLTAV
jgi:hypothetical protein